MTARTLKILHIEDEETQRRVVAHHLGGRADLQFEIYYADAEEDALNLFQAGGMELVLLDYNLRQGDGLHGLQEMRNLDPIIPIIALSGVASSEIASELVQAGADDFIDKRNLTSGILASTMRDALGRADACRKRLQSGT